MATSNGYFNTILAPKQNFKGKNELKIVNAKNISKLIKLNYILPKNNQELWTKQQWAISI